MFKSKYSENNQYFGHEIITGLEKIIRSASSENCKAIDIGCGQGRDALYLARRGIKVTAFDLEAIAVEQLREIAERDALPLTALCQDIRTAELPPDFYDIGIARTIFDHLNKVDVPIAVKKLKATVRKDGHVFITVFTEEDPGYHCKPGIMSECSASIKHYFEKGELREYFADWKIIFYSEHVKNDLTHGPPHKHGVAKLIAKKGTSHPCKL